MFAHREFDLCILSLEQVQKDRLMSRGRFIDSGISMMRAQHFKVPRVIVISGHNGTGGNIAVNGIYERSLDACMCCCHDTLSINLSIYRRLPKILVGGQETCCICNPSSAHPQVTSRSMQM